MVPEEGKILKKAIQSIFTLHLFSHILVSSFLSGFILFMLCSFNPETVSSSLCCYTVLLRVQVFLSRLSHSCLRF